MLKIGQLQIESRLFLGTGKFSSYQLMSQAIVASQSQLVTVALKRIDLGSAPDQMLSSLDLEGVNLLPNTSGVRNAKEALFAAKLAREALQTDLLKLEIHPDPKYLLPDPIETLRAAELLVKEGFTVLPYCGADPVLCKHLEQVGCAAVMPLASPIGSNRGLETKGMLEIIIAQAGVPVVIDAGLGSPSDAALAMELGADAVLVNTAIASSNDPVRMAEAFKLATQAGRAAFEATLAPRLRGASPSSPLTSFLDAAGA